MNTRVMALLAVLLSGCANGCRPSSMLSDVTRIVYTSEAGALLPELRWFERYIIATDHVTFERSGMVSETQVNAGTWVIGVDRRLISGLLAEVAAADPSRIRRVEPADPPDGGSSNCYTVYHGGNKALELRFDPGVDYTDGAQITAPIDAFLRGLTLPAEARSRYRDTP